MVCTVVSAYYPIGDRSLYMPHVIRFLQNIRAPLVFFTENDDLEESLRQHCLTDQAVFVVLPMSEFTAMKKHGLDFWKSHIARDYDKTTSVEMSCMLYEKMYLVQRAIEINQFDTDRYIWCDATIVTSDEDVPALQTFALNCDHKIKEDNITIMKMLNTYDTMLDSLSLLSRLTNPLRWIPFTYFEYPSKGMDIDVIAGNRNAWSSLTDKYEEMLHLYTDNNLSASRAHYIVASVYFKYPALFNVVELHNRKMIEYFSSHF